MVMRERLRFECCGNSPLFAGAAFPRQTGDLLDTRQLQAFLGAVDTGSFTRAATVLHVSQPTVTNRIKALERALGSTLLERLPGGVRPTSAGRTLLSYAREIVRLSSEIHRLVDSPGQPSGRVTVGAPESLINQRLLPLIEYIHLRYPQIDFSLRLSTPQEAAAHLCNGLLDCAFTIGDGTPHGDLDHRELCPEPLALVAAPLRDTGSRRDSEEEPFDFDSVLVCADVDGRYCGDLLPDAALSTGSRRMLSLNSVEAVKHMAENGIGAALLPEISVAEDITNGRLRKLNWQPVTRTYTQALWRHSNVSRPALEAVLKAAAKVISES
ncbi:LysR family transcriptional regulator [Streptomyces sp. NPDC093598]|uniref:LysR family transcriptional regulator n=1 Tax=Streptomyces sp. NPDC093598 TaxID=3366046 RepID=UPI003808C6EE